MWGDPDRPVSDETGERGIGRDTDEEAMAIRLSGHAKA